MNKKIVMDYVSLIKPAKHGDQITLEDYTENLSKIESFLNSHESKLSLFFSNVSFLGNVSDFSDLDKLTDKLNGDTYFVTGEHAYFTYVEDIDSWLPHPINLINSVGFHTYDGTHDNLASFSNIDLVISPDENINLDGGRGVSLPSVAAATELINARVGAAHTTLLEFAVADTAEAFDIIKDFDSGKAITATNGKTYCNGKDVSVSCDIHAAPYEIITFIRKQGSSFLSETFGVGVDLMLTPYSSRNSFNTGLLDLEDRVIINEDDIQTLEAMQGNYLKKDGTTELPSGYAPTKDGQVAPVGMLKQLALHLEDLITTNATHINDNVSRLNTAEPKVTSNKLGVADYFDNKGDFVRVEDIKSMIKNVGDKSLPVKNGKDYVWTLTQDMVKGFNKGDATTNPVTDPDVINIKVSSDTESEYFSDSFNDGKTTPVTVGHKSYTVEITDTEFKVNTNEDLSNFKLIYLETMGQAGGTIDLTARQDSAAAQTTANAAKTQATTNKNKIGVNIANITSSFDRLDHIESKNVVQADGTINDLSDVKEDSLAHDGNLATVGYIDKNTSVINLSTLNSKEISAAIPSAPDNKYYLIKHTNGEAILTYTMLSNGNKLLQGMSKDGFQYVLLDHTSTATPFLEFGSLQVGKPMKPEHATTKKYVDTELAKKATKVYVDTAIKNIPNQYKKIHDFGSSGDSFMVNNWKSKSNDYIVKNAYTSVKCSFIDGTLTTFGTTSLDDPKNKFEVNFETNGNITTLRWGAATCCVALYERQ